MGDPAINYCLKSAVAIALHFQLCSARYTVLQMKDGIRSASAINLVTTKNMDDSVYKHTVWEAMHHTTTNRHLRLSAKEMGHKGGQR